MINSCKKDEIELKDGSPKNRKSPAPVETLLEAQYYATIFSNDDIEYQWDEQYAELDLRAEYTIHIPGRSTAYVINSNHNFIVHDVLSKRIVYVIKTEAAREEFINNIEEYYKAAEYFKDKSMPTVFAEPIILATTKSDDSWDGRLIGKTTDRGNKEDLDHGTNGDPTGILKQEMFNYSDENLFGEMTELVKTFSSRNLQPVALGFVDNFKTNTSNSTTFSDETLNLEVSKHPSLKLFLQKFANTLHVHLQHYKGKINDVPIIDVPIRPVFNTFADALGGLQILVNDTEKTEIRLVSYEILPGGRRFSADIETTIYDHFGLDKNDVLTYQTKNDGFTAWWILQHQRNKVPFITEMIVRHNITAQFPHKSKNMNSHLKNIAIVTTILLLLNGCRKPQLKFELVTQKTRSDRSLQRSYVVTDYKNDDRSDEEIRAFAYKVADSINLTSYYNISVAFYKPNEKVDLQAVKEGRAELVPEDNFAKYSWANGKLIFAYIDKEARQAKPVVIEDNKTGFPPPIVTAIPDSTDDITNAAK